MFKAHLKYIYALKSKVNRWAPIKS